MKLCVTYHRPQDLVADYEQQFARGGLLVTVPVDDSVQRDTAVELLLVTPFGAVELAASVIQAMPGAGVAVGFDPATMAQLDALVAEARAADPSDGDAPSHELLTDGDEAATWARRHVRNIAESKVDLIARLKTASVAEKMQIALHGSKDERTILMRDTNRTLHKYVIRNPHIQLDEVATIAKTPTVAAEVLLFIAARREWFQRPEVAGALVRNPKTPVPLAVKMVPFISLTEARMLAKAQGVRAPVLRAIRTKLMNR